MPPIQHTGVYARKSFHLLTRFGYLQGMLRNHIFGLWWSWFYFTYLDLSILLSICYYEIQTKYGYCIAIVGWGPRLHNLQNDNLFCESLQQNCLHVPSKRPQVFNLSFKTSAQNTWRNSSCNSQFRSTVILTSNQKCMAKLKVFKETCLILF